MLGINCNGQTIQDFAELFCEMLDFAAAKVAMEFAMEFFLVLFYLNR